MIPILALAVLRLLSVSADESCESAQIAEVDLSEADVKSARMLTSEGRMYLEMEAWQEAEESYRQAYNIYHAAISGFSPKLCA